MSPTKAADAAAIPSALNTTGLQCDWIQAMLPAKGNWPS